nr:uncharacterized protein LOC123762115 isoform X6 [Procambarus clarkii]
MVREMFRQRLRGGHKVGGPSSITRSLQGQTDFSRQTGNLVGSQYNASIPPSQSGPTQQPRQPEEQLQQQQQLYPTGNSGSGWGGDSSDGAWNWGDGDAWSWNANQANNPRYQQVNHRQQQPLLSRRHPQQPSQQYDQQHAYSQHLQYTSQHQFSKATQNDTYSSTSVTGTASSLDENRVPTNNPQHPQPQLQQQQYVNGNAQNGQGTDDWGADNWGNDWGNAEPYNNNNNNNKPANYAKQENRQQHQDYHSYQEHQQQQPTCQVYPQQPQQQQQQLAHQNYPQQQQQLAHQSYPQQQQQQQQPSQRQEYHHHQYFPLQQQQENAHQQLNPDPVVHQQLNKDTVIHQQLNQEPVHQQLNQEPVHQQLNQEPVHQQLKQEPVHQQLNQEPVHQQLNQEPVHQQLNQEPVHQQLNQEPVHQQLNQEPVHQQLNQEPVHQQLNQDLQQQFENQYPQDSQQEYQQNFNSLQEYNQQQQYSETTKQYVDEDWGWGIDDWQVNGQTAEHRENIHQLTNPAETQQPAGSLDTLKSQQPPESWQPSESEQPAKSQNTADSWQPVQIQQKDLQAVHNNNNQTIPSEAKPHDHPQQGSAEALRTASSRDSAGDGWPDWEGEHAHGIKANRDSIQHIQTPEEQARGFSSVITASYQGDEAHKAECQEPQQQQPWDDGWGHRDISNHSDDAGTAVPDNFTATQDSYIPTSSVPQNYSTLSGSTTMLEHVKHDWEQESIETYDVQRITDGYVKNLETQPILEQQNIPMHQVETQSSNTSTNNPSLESSVAPLLMAESTVSGEHEAHAMLNTLDDRWGDGWGETEAHLEPDEVIKVSNKPEVHSQESCPDSEHVHSHETRQLEQLHSLDREMNVSIAPVHSYSDFYPQNTAERQPHTEEEESHRAQERNENKPSEEQQYHDGYSSGAVTQSSGWDDEWDQEIVITKSEDTSPLSSRDETCTSDNSKCEMEYVTKGVDNLTLSEDTHDPKEPLALSTESLLQELPPQTLQHRHFLTEAPQQELQHNSLLEQNVLLDSESHNQSRTECYESPQNYDIGYVPHSYPQAPQESTSQVDLALKELHLNYPSIQQTEHEQRQEQQHQYEPQNQYMKQINQPLPSLSPKPTSIKPPNEPEVLPQEKHFQPPTSSQPLGQPEAHPPVAGHSYQHHRDMNQEIVQHPSTLITPLPDPLFSRIPDGASSIPEVPPVVGTDDDESSHIEDVYRPLIMSAGQQVSERPSSSQSVSSQPGCLSSQPVRPPSSHIFPDRPASNQSAHSVHSIHSVRSTQSAHSTHSFISQNQEVPLAEKSKIPACRSSLSQIGQQEECATVVQTNSSVDLSTDGTASPSNHSVGPPPVSGPLGVVSSLKARKGSPFQPPSVKPSTPGIASDATYQSQFFSSPQTATTSTVTSVPGPAFPDVSANLETTPDNNEQPSDPVKTGVPLWSASEDMLINVKLAVVSPSVDTFASTKSQLSSNIIPLVISGMVKEEKTELDAPTNQHSAATVHPEPPAAHSANLQAAVVKPKILSLSNMSAIPTAPHVLDLSRPSRSTIEPRGDGSQNISDRPNFSRMVPGESSKGESTTVSTYQAPSIVPSMPSERVVTGNDNPQPVLPVRIKQEPPEVRSPPDGPYTSNLMSTGASVIPPIRSETIGSEEPTSRNFTTTNSGSRSDLANDHRADRGGRWERDHSRDRDSRNDKYRDGSREHNRDYYRDDSPHSRRSYDRDYDRKYDDDRRRWRKESDEEEDGDRRYYESRDRRERAYRDELDRYSDRPIKEEERSHSRDKRHDYRERPKDYYRTFDEDPYYGRGDRSRPVSRSSSINNLDNDGERSVHSHRSRHDYYARHDRRDSHSRDSDPRDKDAPYTRDPREKDFYQRGWDTRDRRDTRYYNQRGGYEDAYGSRDLYNQYHYASYYQYYRDHPYYKDYYKQWMKQYGQAYQPETFYDDRTSIHSGRSSVNDDLKKSVSSPRAAYDPYGYYYGHTSQPPYNSSGELSGVPSVTDDVGSEAPQRMTPVLFGSAHINAQFTPGGQLLFVLPKDPRDGQKAVVQLRDVQKMLCMNPALNKTVQQMKHYPGPLTLSDTHKDVVVKYCEQQVAEATRNQSLHDKESVILIWEYLALLVKQNGKLYGSDVAGLLLNGRDEPSQVQQVSLPIKSETPPESLSMDASPQDEGIDISTQTLPTMPERNEAVLFKKFTEYLCLGRKREAVDYAMREGLWGHALALSYKMDTTTHTRVLAAFSSSIPHTNVLLTLFQQLSGKRPEITKSYTPQQWGDWRQHLAMMISNPTGHTQRDRASIVALGDTLASQGQLYAAHFCYLMAEVEWGSYSNKDSKLVLIGSSHQLPFQAFASNEAIQCTEVYEFARSLDSSNPLLDTFQSYKLVYALRLTEYGFPAEALRYCEVISQLVNKTPAPHKAEFLSQVYDLASRLKYHDLHYQMCQGEVSEMPDPQWLADFQGVVEAAKAHAAQMTTMEDSYQTQPDGAKDSSHGITAVLDSNRQAHLSAAEPYQYFVKSDNSFHTLNSTTNNSYLQDTTLIEAPPSQVTFSDTMDGVYQHQHPANHLASSQSPEGLNDTSQLRDVMPPSKESTPRHEVPVIQNTQQDQTQYSYSGGYWPGYSQPDPNASLYMQNNSPEETHGSLPPSPETSGEQRRGSVTPMSQPNNLSNYQPYQEPYQAWEQQQQANDMSESMPSRSQETNDSDLSSHTQRTPEEEAYWAEMTGKKGSIDLKRVDKKSEKGDGERCPREPLVHPLKLENKTKRVSFKPQASQKERRESWADTEQQTSSAGEISSTCSQVQNSTNPAGHHNVNNTTDTSIKDKSDSDKKSDKDLDKSQDKGGGWSLSKLLGWNKSKQAVLPDDKNPTIIWDENKKKWVNQDGDEEVTAPPPPPPKSAISGPGAPPLMMTRGGPRKSRYVNTEKDSSKGMAGGMPVNLPNSMLPPMPGAPMITGGPSMSPPVMVPAPVQLQQGGRDTPDGLQAAQGVGHQEQQQAPVPQVTPTLAPLPDIAQMRRSRYISESSIELEDDWPPANTEGTSNDGSEGAGFVPMIGPPTGQPQFFNPAQFNTPVTSNVNQTRRLGPGRRSLPAKRQEFT